MVQYAYLRHEQCTFAVNASMRGKLDMDCFVNKMVWMSPRFHADERVFVLTGLSCLCASSDGTGAGYGGAV